MPLRHGMVSLFFSRSKHTHQYYGPCTYSLLLPGLLRLHMYPAIRVCVGVDVGGCRLLIISWTTCFDPPSNENADGSGVKLGGLPRGGSSPHLPPMWLGLL